MPNNKVPHPETPAEFAHVPKAWHIGFEDGFFGTAALDWPDPRLSELAEGYRDGYQHGLIYGAARNKVMKNEEELI